MERRDREQRDARRHGDRQRGRQGRHVLGVGNAIGGHLEPGAERG